MRLFSLRELMALFSLRMGMILLCAGAVLFSAAGPAMCLTYRLLLATPQRELRSARLVVQGRSTLPQTATAEAHLQSALAQAQRQALAMVREDLQSKLRQRSLELTLAFLGQAANATRPPEDDETVRLASVYVHQATDLGALSGQGNAVEATLEVIYTLERNATAAPVFSGSSPTAPTLPLAAPRGGVFGPAPAQDANSTQAIIRMLEQGAESLRDGLE